MYRDELVSYLNNFLRIRDYKDIAPNGIQVEGRNEIKRIVTAVSASVELFERALDEKADAVLVHHGIILDFERPVYRGGYKKRVKLLLENDINLIAYHIPLDANEQVGNNVRIAQALGMTEIAPFGDYKGQFIGFRGQLSDLPAEAVFDKIRNEINSNVLIFPYGPQTIRTAGVISGGAQKDVKQAVNENLDLYITGEVSEHILHYVKEEGIHFAAAGHHATERFGIRALGDHVAEKFGLDVKYVEIPNPV